MGLFYNFVKKSFVLVCTTCAHIGESTSISNYVKEGWGIKLNDKGNMVFCMCPDCKVGYDLKLIQEKYGNREDLSYGELVAVQEEWYND